MLDHHVRPWIDPLVNWIGKKLAACGLTANTLTIIGFMFGVIAMFCIMLQLYYAGLLFFILNRICDGLDGAVARHIALTDFGGFLDIVCDFIIYAGIVFAFGVANPDKSLYAAFLIFSFIGPMASFLAYAIVAAKQKIETTRRGHKSFYYLGGICEGVETIVALVSMCLFTNYFAVICMIFGGLCWLTTAGRVYCAWSDFHRR